MNRGQMVRCFLKIEGYPEGLTRILFWDRHQTPGWSYEVGSDGQLKEVREYVAETSPRRIEMDGNSGIKLIAPERELRIEVTPVVDFWGSMSGGGFEFYFEQGKVCQVVDPATKSIIWGK